MGAVLASKFGVAHRLLALGPVSHFNRGGAESLLHFGEFLQGESPVVGGAGERLVEAGAQLQPSALTTSVLRWAFLGILPEAPPPAVRSTISPK